MPDTPANLYQQLKDALTQFKSFLDGEVPALQSVIHTLKPLVPQVGELLTKLIDLMGQLKTAIGNLPASAPAGADKLAQFTSSATALLQSAEALLPQQKSAIDDVLSVANVVTGLPDLGKVRQDILDLLTSVITDLNAINA